MSFSFDFAVSENDDRAGRSRSDSVEARSVERVLPNDEATSTRNVNRSHLVPFRWVDGVTALLEKRAEQVIAYEEIPLRSSSAGGGVEDSATVIRQVDLSTSSFLDRSQEENHEPMSSCTDLIPGVYEGGLKVWESSLDLLHYMNDHPEETLPDKSEVSLASRPNDARPLRYLELGCGHGLPGCMIIRQAIRRNILDRIEVVFSDYNEFVLSDVLLSNIILNTSDLGMDGVHELAKSIKLGSGDWYGMLPPAPENENVKLMHSFDWIGASETLYTVEAAQETAFLLSHLLCPESGQALVASKRYYFGVGGGVDAFRQAADNQVLIETGSGRTLKLESETLQVYDNGRGNIRELLRVRLRRT
jgi:hypothetical protein